MSLTSSDSRGGLASVAIALGSNLGDRERNLRSAIDQLRCAIDVVRVSRFIETAPCDAPAGSPDFLNAVVIGSTRLAPVALLNALLKIEQRAGRRRPSLRNAPRTIDLDLILHSANLRHTRDLVLPHPRYLQRQFVMQPLREFGLTWRDPATGVSLGDHRSR